MSPENWEKVCGLVDSLVDLPPEEQDRRLAAGDIPDPAIAAEARRLLKRIGIDHSFLSRPVISVPDLLQPTGRRLEEGRRIGGRFVVQQFLGAGGMGEVYSVLDTHLNEVVALKTIRAEWSADSDAVARFYREVQLARRVTHENVCRIFDLGQDLECDPPIVFLTMQCVAGGSLRALLDRGRVPFARARALMLDAIRGLAAAHETGVLHRDFKPGNILLKGLDGDGAVVTDFGLALEESAGTSANQRTTANQLAGTPLYMAPERLQGEPATAAADVYALGLVMYETFAGHLPFADRPPMGALLLRSRQAPASLEREGVPRDWAAAIRRCLEPDPRRRYRDAGEVLQDLARAARPWGFAVPRRTAIASVAGMACLAAAARYWRWDWGGLLPHARPAGDRLLLAPWNLPEGSELQSLEIVMRETLAQSGKVKLWDTERLPGVLARMGAKPSDPMDPASWRQVALREQAPLVLFTSVTTVGDGYAMALRLEQVNPTTPRTAARYWSHAFDAPNRAGLMDTIRDGARWVRATIGESAAEISAADRLPQDITTSSWEALQTFARGERLSTTDAASAILEYDAAIRYDPQFTMAWMRKGDVLMSVERTGDGLVAWKTAIDLSAKRPLTVREDLKLRAMFADDSGDLRQSEKLFAEYIHRFPDDFWGYFYRELPLVMLGFEEEAIAMMRASERFPERRPTALCHLVWDYSARHDFDQAEQCVRDLKAGGFYDRAYWGEAALAYTQRDHGRALEALHNGEAAASGPLKSQMQHEEILVLADAGQTEDAIRRALELVPQDLALGLRAYGALKLTAAAYLVSEHSPARAQELAAKAMETGEGPVVITQAGTILARCGYMDSAARTLALLDGSPDLPRYRVARRRLQGEIALARGRRQEARDHFQAAAAEDLIPYGHEYLARCLLLLGNRTAAAAEYASVAKLRNYELRLLYSELPGITRQAERFRS